MALPVGFVGDDERFGLVAADDDPEEQIEQRGEGYDDYSRHHAADGGCREDNRASVCPRFLQIRLGNESYDQIRPKTSQVS